MTEQEKLHHAKHYIDSLANGLNPLDGTPIPEQDIVNNVKISRCLFFVSDVLRKQLDGHEPKKVSEKDKKLFYITEEEKLQYVPSKTPIPASGISYKVNEISMKKTIKLIDLDCGHCADKIQNAVKKIDGVTSVSVNFLGQKMVLEAPDDKFDAVLAEAKALIKKIEPDVTVKA